MAKQRDSGETNVPLCVDLDGTLIKADMLIRSAMGLIRSRPFCSLRMPLWLLRGKAYLKRQLALRTAFDPAALPYNVTLLDMLRKEKENGRSLLLVTASDVIMAKPIADYLGLFDEVLGSDGTRNVRGSVKAAILKERFGIRGFDYAGNGLADLQVWECCREAIVVGDNRSLVGRTKKLGVVVRTLGE